MRASHSLQCAFTFAFDGSDMFLICFSQNSSFSSPELLPAGESSVSDDKVEEDSSEDEESLGELASLSLLSASSFAMMSLSMKVSVGFFSLLCSFPSFLSAGLGAIFVAA